VAFRVVLLKNVESGLIGGASLEADDFLKVVEAAG